MSMNKEQAWKQFVDTGDPSYYMLYKSMDGIERKLKDENL